MVPINKKRIEPDFDNSQIPYLPIRYRNRLRSTIVRYQVSKKIRFKKTADKKTRTKQIKTIELKQPDKSELEMISQWIRHKSIYKAFGFKRPVAVNYTKRKRLPNGYGTFEPVEFLVVVHKGTRKIIGFFIVYELCKVGRISQEFDFAITDPQYKGSLTLLLHIRFALLTYLFYVCGVKEYAFWKRESKAWGWEQTIEDFKRKLKVTLKKKGPDAIQII
jgi:hypothetical protein